MENFISRDERRPPQRFRVKEDAALKSQVISISYGNERLPGSKTVQT